MQSSSLHTLSDQAFTAQTAPQTVMAEQVAHNVVDQSESTGAQAPVDVAANQPTTVAADHGNLDQPHSPNTIASFSEESQAANEHAAHANASIPSMQTDPPSDPAPVQQYHEGHVEGKTEAPAHTFGVEQHASTQAPGVNGTYDVAVPAEAVFEDASFAEGSADVSVASDTEGSRGDASELKKDDKNHTRTNSVKKPLTFSKVSVTKNFLAKSATATPPLVKPGERPSPASTPLSLSAVKPRLIAKTGMSLRDVQKTRSAADTTSGPDASKVWNKNQPVAPPPPKQFTDEELKQQYGIHLATRLQSDEDGKQSKWADIDDDEEDWAPEPVVWMDGTKSTLMANEAAAAAAAAPPPPEQQSTPAPPTKPAEPVRPTLVMRRPAEPGSTKTVLKPGANLAATQSQQGEAGATASANKVLVGASKNLGALPAKSPWAPLPPVEKVSPINPPVQQRQAPLPFASQDARSYEPAQHAPPAREIAADTFDRFARDGETGPRELFNSANGKYEPVQEGRRGSMKPDRKHSLLQRHSGSGPAEPSAAFQTRSNVQSESRRRGSSFSQGSLPPAIRRMSKASETSPALSSAIIEHETRASPKVAKGEPAQPVFAQQSAWQQQMPTKPTVEMEDPVAVQERVMREKREEAKRRREDEAREEAERKERLKAKLASLEGAGKSRKERDAEAAAAAAASAATTATPPPPASKETAQLAAQTVAAEPPPPAKPSDTTTTALDPSVNEAAPPKEPSPQESLPAPIPPPPSAAGLPPRPISNTAPTARHPTNPAQSPKASSRVPFQQTSAAFGQTSPSYTSPRDRKPQSFERSPLSNNNAFSPWPTTALSSGSGSVWGTAGIGNGTFESSNVFAPMSNSQHSSTLPLPPGMNRAPGSNRIPPQSLGTESRSPSGPQQSLLESNMTFAPPGLEARPDAFANQARVNGTSPAPGLGRQTHLPGPIAPPSRAAQQQTQQQSTQRQGALAAWNNAAQMLPYQYKADADSAERKALESSTVAPRNDTFKETFKQTIVDPNRLGGPRRYEKIEYTVHDAQGSRSVPSLSPAPPNAQTQPMISPSASSAHQLAGENTVRLPDASSQLPQAPLSARAPHLRKQYAAQAAAEEATSPLPPSAQSKEESPPPPETASHPVHGGDIGHPLVKMPPPQPTVRLPPAASPSTLPQQMQAMPPPRPVNSFGVPGTARPLVMQEAWQARFNGLFNRTHVHTEIPPSPPKTPPKMQGPALAVASSSRTAMDEAPRSSSATVSLPQAKIAMHQQGYPASILADATSKPMIEQMFGEELSFGSSPKVRVPKQTAYAIASEGLPAHTMLAKLPNAKLPTSIEARSVAEVNLRDIHPKRHDGYFIHLPLLKLVRKFAQQQQQQRQLSGSRKTSANHSSYQERRASGKFKGKGDEGTAATGESRKSSFQKTTTSTPNSGSPAPGTPSTPTHGRRTSWAKPSKGGRGGSGRGSTPIKAN